jgi:hypothetical protein
MGPNSNGRSAAIPVCKFAFKRKYPVSGATKNK